MKRNVLLALIFSMFLLVFNLLFFLLGDNSIRNASTWLSYGFINFSYLIFLLSAFVNRKSAGDNAYEAPTVYITWKYFTMELIVGLIFIWINPEGIGWALSVQLILAAVSIVMWLVHLMANEHTADSIETQQKEIMYIRDSCERLKLICFRTSDKDMARKIDRCREILNASPAHTSPRVARIEREISDSITELDDAVEAKDSESAVRLLDHIKQLVQERNFKLKNLN